MKNTMKKLLSAMLCALLVLTLGACGKKTTSSDTQSSDDPILVGIEGTDRVDVGDNTDESGDGNATTVGGSTEDYGGATVTDRVVIASGSDPFAKIPSRLKGTTVRFATWGDESGSVYMKVIKAFEKKTGINVEIVQYNQASYKESIATQIVNKAAPDVIIADDFPSSISIVQPVQKLVDINDNFWDQEIIRMSTVNGNTYFLNSWEGPWQSTMLVYYNKKLFDDEGINSPGDYYEAGQWSYENYIKCAREMNKLGYKTRFDPITFNQQLGNPTLKYDPATQRYTNNILNTTEGYKLKLQFINEGIDENTTDNDFISAKAAMVTTGPFGSKYNGYFKSMDDSQIAAVPMPDSYQGQKISQATSHGARSYGICKGAKNPEGAVYFLRYFLDYKYYKAAGANCFKNEALESFYFGDMSKIYRNNKNRLIEYYGGACNFAGYSADQYSIEKGLAGLKESEIPTLIASKANIYEASAKAVNDYIAGLK